MLTSFSLQRTCFITMKKGFKNVSNSIMFNDDHGLNITLFILHEMLWVVHASTTLAWGCPKNS